MPFWITYAFSGYSDTPARLEAAARAADDSVFAFARGSGGSTLSAVVVERTGEAHTVNVGDSRSYSFSRGKSTDRLTVDDSLAEAVGGHGRELIQFVGMGDGIKPHVRRIPDGSTGFLITTYPTDKIKEGERIWPT